MVRGKFLDPDRYRFLYSSHIIVRGGFTCRGLVAFFDLHNKNVDFTRCD